MARDLVNTPGGSLNARDMAEVALQVAKENGLDGRGDGRGRDGEGGHGRHARREQGLGRAASPHQDDVLTSQPERIGGAGRQGDHVRLRRAVAEVGRGDDVDEDRHVGSGRRARDDERAQDDEAEGEGRRVPLLHRQHAEWHRAQARRRDHDPQRQDRRGAEHRRRGTARPRRRALARGRGERRCHRRPRDADRRGGRRAGQPHRRRDGQRRRLDGPGAQRCGARGRERVAAPASRPSTGASSTHRSPT